MQTLLRSARALAMLASSFFLVLSVLSTAADLHAQNTAAPQSENEAALGVYADAANFQNKGELELAIEQWQRFLKDFGDDPMAPKAAHYLGVCYMQLAEPRYKQAAAAFATALKSKDYELREESLSNLGWCEYAVGSEPEAVGEASLKRAIAAFNQLRKEFRNSRFADRAAFYTGESYYNLGRLNEAVRAYDQLLNAKDAEKSALRCDALYAKGIALEELDQSAKAVLAYREMLRSCAEDPLASAVRLQLAELLIRQKEFNEAEQLFARVAETGPPEDVPRSMFRRAFVLVQLNRAADAAKVYARLESNYPDSPFAAAARMAAAQSLYRAGELEAAAEKFRDVIGDSNDLASSTEAAHWIAVIEMGRGRMEEANRVAREQIQRGLDGPYSMSLRVDAAEALSMLPNGTAQALREFETLLDGAPDDSLTPRVIYNASFAALQLGQNAKVVAWSRLFERNYLQDSLLPDVRYLGAEALLASGQVEPAITKYRQLLSSVERNNPQLPMWMLRAATAALTAGQPDEAIDWAGEALGGLTGGEQKAEASLIIGNGYAASDRPTLAIQAFDRAMQLAPDWQRVPEILLRKAAAQVAVNDTAGANRTWQTIMRQHRDSAIADQARYRMAQQAAEMGNINQAVMLYDQLLADLQDLSLRPFGLYGRGWALLQDQRYEQAAKSLTAFIEEYPDHPLRDDCVLARAMCFRRLDQLEKAQDDLKTFMQLSPEGITLGHGLYEQGLVYRQLGKPDAAVTSLQRVLREIPNYPAADDVLFELAWCQTDLGKTKAATDSFQQLVRGFPDSMHVAEASYQVGQTAYADQSWERAAEAFAAAADAAKETDVLERSLYRLGWANFQAGQFDTAAQAFERQIAQCPTGSFFIDALMMVAECKFNKEDYASALRAYERARDTIVKVDGPNRKFMDAAEKQVRELVYLHGGQSAGQLKQWDAALRWYDQLRERYPNSNYIAQVFYETGFAYQQMGKSDEAVKFFTETANNFRDESAARARFMLGEIYFQRNEPSEAIKEFKRVMYGFGAEKAPEPIRDWQAKSGFEAGRCAELLVQANRGEKRTQAIELAQRYYGYVLENHSKHALANKARDRMDVLKRL